MKGKADLIGPTPSVVRKQHKYFQVDTPQEGEVESDGGENALCFIDQEPFQSPTFRACIDDK